MKKGCELCISLTGIPRNLQNKFAGLAIFSLLLFLFGCATQQLVPLSGNGMVEDKRTTFQSEGGVEVTVNSSPWFYYPRSLNDYTTPFYIEIYNGSKSKIIVNRNDITLVDDFNNQYNTLTPQAVADIVKSTSGYAYGPNYPYITIGLGANFGRGYYGWGRYYRRPYGFFGYYPFYFPPPPAYYIRHVDTRNIFSKAFIPGPVNSGALLKGYIYFNKLTSGSREVRLEIGYKSEAEEEKYSLTFPFIVENY